MAVNMNDLKSNSHRSKSMAADNSREKQEHRAKSVATGKVKTKKNQGRNLMNIFISEDASNVKSFVFMDVLVPAIKKAFYDVIVGSAERVFYGEGGGGSSRGSSYGGRTSYRSYYDNRNSRNDSPRSAYESRTRFDYDDVTFATRRDAIAVREELYAASREYGFARVLDLYDAAGLTVDYTAANYGWFHLDNIDIIQLRNGDWTLKLPKAMPIDRN